LQVAFLVLFGILVHLLGVQARLLQGLAVLGLGSLLRNQLRENIAEEIPAIKRQPDSRMMQGFRNGAHLRLLHNQQITFSLVRSEMLGPEPAAARLTLARTDSASSRCTAWRLVVVERVWRRRRSSAWRSASRRASRSIADWVRRAGALDFMGAGIFKEAAVLAACGALPGRRCSRCSVRSLNGFVLVATRPPAALTAADDDVSSSWPKLQCSRLKSGGSAPASWLFFFCFFCCFCLEEVAAFPSSTSPYLAASRDFRSSSIRRCLSAISPGVALRPSSSSERMRMRICRSSSSSSRSCCRARTASPELLVGGTGLARKSAAAAGAAAELRGASGRAAARWWAPLLTSLPDLLPARLLLLAQLLEQRHPHVCRHWAGVETDPAGRLLLVPLASPFGFELQQRAALAKRGRPGRRLAQGHGERLRDGAAQGGCGGCGRGRLLHQRPHRLPGAAAALQTAVQRGGAPPPMPAARRLARSGHVKVGPHRLDAGPQQLLVAPTNRPSRSSRLFDFCVVVDGCCGGFAASNSARDRSSARLERMKASEAGVEELLLGGLGRLRLAILVVHAEPVETLAQPQGLPLLGSESRQAGGVEAAGVRGRQAGDLSPTGCQAGLQQAGGLGEGGCTRSQYAKFLTKTRSRTAEQNQQNIQRQFDARAISSAHQQLLLIDIFPLNNIADTILGARNAASFQLKLQGPQQSIEVYVVNFHAESRLLRCRHTNSVVASVADFSADQAMPLFTPNFRHASALRASRAERAQSGSLAISSAEAAALLVSNQAGFGTGGSRIFRVEYHGSQTAHELLQQLRQPINHFSQCARDAAQSLVHASVFPHCTLEVHSDVAQEEVLHDPAVSIVGRATALHTAKQHLQRPPHKTHEVFRLPLLDRRLLHHSKRDGLHMVRFKALLVEAVLAADDLLDQVLESDEQLALESSETAEHPLLQEAGAHTELLASSTRRGCVHHGLQHRLRDVRSGDSLGLERRDGRVATEAASGDIVQCRSHWEPSLSFDKQLDDLRMPILGCDVEWRRSCASLKIDVCLSFDKRVYDVQWCRANVLLKVDISSRFDQCVDYLLMSILCRNIKRARRATIDVLKIDVGLSLDEGLDDFDVTVLRCHVQRHAKCKREVSSPFLSISRSLFNGFSGYLAMVGKPSVITASRILSLVGSDPFLCSFVKSESEACIRTAAMSLWALRWSVKFLLTLFQMPQSEFMGPGQRGSSGQQRLAGASLLQVGLVKVHHLLCRQQANQEDGANVQRRLGEVQQVVVAVLIDMAGQGARQRSYIVRQVQRVRLVDKAEAAHEPHAVHDGQADGGADSPLLRADAAAVPAVAKHGREVHNAQRAERQAQAAAEHQDEARRDAARPERALTRRRRRLGLSAGSVTVVGVNHAGNCGLRLETAFQSLSGVEPERLRVYEMRCAQLLSMHIRVFMAGHLLSSSLQFSFPHCLRDSGSVDFYRNWTQYQSAFGGDLTKTTGSGSVKCVINAGCDDESRIYGYRRNQLRTALTYAGFVLTAFLLRLVFHWKPEWYVKCTHDRCSLRRAEKLVIKDQYQQFFVHDICIVTRTGAR
uniref:Cation-transporting ATPase n=1 Tax=Macrostomum lignano TaxID=282301 RepID=A0A1I8I8Z8_9PLAT